VPGGHVPASSSEHAGGAPPQHGLTQYCVTPQVCVPHMNGAGAGGVAASVPESIVVLPVGLVEELLPHASARTIAAPTAQTTTGARVTV